MRIARFPHFVSGPVLLAGALLLADLGAAEPGELLRGPVEARSLSVLDGDTLRV
jgi:hypothetical protein